MSELNPCPFCGGEVKLVTDFSQNKDHVYCFECEECGAIVYMDDLIDKDKSIESWNKRPNPWHTGTPKRENLEHEHCYAISHNVGHGFHLVGTLFKANHENGCFESKEVYDNIGNVDTLKFEFNDKNIRWQKIDLYEEEK